MMRISLTLLAVSVAGCANSEPYRRMDVWSPTGSNAGNIAAMVANPDDLLRGRSDNTGDAHQAAGGVDRVWQDRTKLLPGSTDVAPPTGGVGTPGVPN